MKATNYIKIAVRESRRSAGRIGLFVACIAVGVAAIVLVAGLSDSVTGGIKGEGRRLLAADVAVEGRRPIPAELDGIVSEWTKQRFGQTADIKRADVREFVSVVAAPAGDKSQLAELKIVRGGYPFYGGLKLDPPRPLGDLLAPDAAVVAPALLIQLGLKVGDSLQIGGEPFRIAGTVSEEPDQVEISFSLGPRVFLSPAGLDRTSLVDRGARVSYKALLKLPAAATEADAEALRLRIEKDIPDSEAYSTRTFANAQPSLRRAFDRMGRYLGLVGLLSLLVGGVGVAQVARVWLASRMNDIAVLRCVGMTPAGVVWVFLLQVLAMAALASVIGAALGTALMWLLPRFLGGLLPAELVRPWQPAAVAYGCTLGVAVALVFTLPLLIGLRRVPPVRVLRRDAEPTRAGWGANLATVALVVGGVWVAAAIQAESFKYGSYFAGGLVAAVLFLALAAAGAGRLTRLLPRDFGGLRLRHGLAHLGRPGAATVGAIVALGLGVTFVFATSLVQRHLEDRLKTELPADAPSTFLLDVQPDQLQPLKDLLAREGATGVDSQPIVTARFDSVAGKSVQQIVDADGLVAGGRRANTRTLRRELRVTYGPALPRGNAVIDGSFPSGNPNGVSIEERFAGEIGVTVGDAIVLDVQGVPVPLTVTSIRTVDWATFGINFFMFAEPGPLDDAPQTNVAVARFPAGDVARLQTEIVRDFPNVTAIQIRDILDKIVAVLGNLALAVRLLGVFIIVAGVVVLGGTVAATQARRSREVALLKTIGMTRGDVAAVFAVEYALTGAVAAVVGIVAALLLAWAVLTRLMELPWSPRAGELVVAFVVTVALSVVAGLLASVRALRARPSEMLRAE